jgi:uncharacterized protein YegL
MYNELLSSSKPGLIIICIDQSGSMADSYTSGNKAEFAAKAVNRVIAEIIAACTDQEMIKDRCHIAVIGYGASTSVLFLNKVSELAQNQNTESLKKKVYDNAGGLIEVDDIMRVFVNPVASGGTPMAEAFREAYNGAEKFIGKNPNSFPPIVINITDGEPNDMGSAKVEAQKLTQLKTSNGNLILMNAHISNSSAGKIELPNNNSGIQGNSYAEFLYDISTVLPDKLAEKARDAGFNVQTDARGFVFNADAETLIKLLNFGTVGNLR